MNKIININPLGSPWKTQDPFLFCAYHRDEYPKGNEKMGFDFEDLKGRMIGQDFVVKDGWRMYHGTNMPGFPYHPHRGFETVSINKEGVIDHTDSLGAAGRFMGGDVQWMTAGKGIQHSEIFPMVNQDKPNPLEIFQIWLNLPKVSKMVAPHFKMLWKEDIPVEVFTDDAGNKTTIEVIAGNINDINAPKPTPNSWANNPENAVRILTVKLDPFAEWTLNQTLKEANRSVFFYKGNSIQVEDEVLQNSAVLELVADQDIRFINGDSASFLLVLEGKPINEPVVQHGPFVMNTQEEIRETMREYGKTQFGGWPWPQVEQAHERQVGRFALHSDGSREDK